MKSNTPNPIICGTDFSENAAQAATVAAIIAARSGKPLLLVHAADEFDALAGDHEKLASELKPLAKRLRGEAYRLRQAGAIVATKLLTGQVPEKAIQKLSGHRAAALVVVSSVSKGAFDRLTLGSVSEHLAQNDPTPTLIVRSAQPFEAWANGERPLRVFVAADFGSVSDMALLWARYLRSLGPCEIVVAHVDRPAEECERLGIAPSFLENPPVVQEMLERDLRERVRAHLGEENVRIVVEPSPGRYDSRLVELALEAQSDLMIVGTNHRQGLSELANPSVALGIQRHAPMSVVCVRAVPAAVSPATGIRECARVLAPVEFDALPGFTVPPAYSIVHRGGVVRLLHNIVPVNRLSPSPGTASQEDHAMRVAEAEAKLRTLIPRDADERGITTEVEVTASRETGETICAAAERFGADVVCLGARTRPSFAAKVLGSVSLAVLQNCRSPVLMVWPPAE